MNRKDGKCNLYPNIVSEAKEDLAALALSMGPELFGNCLKVSPPFRSYWVMGSILHMSNMMEEIDDYCRKPGCIVRDFSQICVVQTQYPNYGAFKFFWIDADSDQIFAHVSRINNLKAFL